MDLRGFLTCVGLWLFSADGYNAILYAQHWFQLKLAK
jgi:hypothetical protein